MDHFEFPALADMHVHLRQGEMLALVAPHTEQWCQACLAMPNTDPPLLTAQDALRYEAQVKKHLDTCRPLMTCKMQTRTTPRMVEDAAAAGVVGFKLYPLNQTTNAHDGIPRDYFLNPRKYPQFVETLHALAGTSRVAELHGELPDHKPPHAEDLFRLDRHGQFTEVLRAESEYLPFLDFLAEEIKGLRFVLEHVTTEEGVNKISTLHKRGVPCACTITGHHPFITMDDIIKSLLRPHNFCMPPAKTLADRAALGRAMLSGEEWAFLGSDSAPHTARLKERDCGCAGVFTAPLLPHLMLEFFSQSGRMDLLANFCTYYGLKFYGLEASGKMLVGRRRDWTVPTHFNEDLFYRVKPWLGGKTLRWTVSVA